MKKEDLETKNKKLTDKEYEMIILFLVENDIEKIEDLIEDNFSCQSIPDLRGALTNKSAKEIGGILSSLENKGFIYLEERDGPFCKSKNLSVRSSFEPDLYWLDEDYINELDPELEIK